MGSTSCVGLWREEIVPVFGDSEGPIPRLADERSNARLWLPNSFVRETLSSHLASIIAGGNCELLMRKRTNGKESLHAFEKSGASGHWTLCSNGNFWSSCTTLGEKNSILRCVHVG